MEQILIFMWSMFVVLTWNAVCERKRLKKQAGALLAQWIRSPGRMAKIDRDCLKSALIIRYGTGKRFKRIMPIMEKYRIESIGQREAP